MPDKSSLSNRIDRLSIVSDEQKQAMDSLVAVKKVAEEIDKLRDEAKLLPPEKRRELEHAMYAAAKRICNLLSLANEHIEKAFSGRLRDDLDEAMSELKEDVASISSRMLMNESQLIVKKTDEILSDIAYPLGAYGHMHGRIASIDMFVHALGGETELTDECRASIDSARQALGRLRVKDEEMKAKNPFEREFK